MITNTTVFEAGAPSLELEGLNGLFGPKGMPLALRERIGAEVVTAFKDPDVVARMSATGTDIGAAGPAAFAAAMAKQIERVDSIAMALGIARKLKK